MINNRIIFAIIMSSIIFGQNLSEKPRKPFMNTDDISFLGTSNRITSILDEAKQFLSDAIIADVNSDTVEVVYNIKKVFDLLSDVEQIGVREELDKKGKKIYDDLRKENDSLLKSGMTQKQINAMRLKRHKEK